MTLTVTKKDLTELVAGESHKELSNSICRGVEYDSRQVQQGNLFIALKGEIAHGESFLQDAFDKGALFALVEDQNLLSASPYADRLIRVEDSLKAFWKIASWWREKTNVPTVAITGSVGKTTTKELLASILKVAVGQGNYALKSFNNHVGVPYTICRTVKEDNWAVVEIGTNHPGEIAPLSKIASPDVAVVTEVGAAHIGAFESIEEIAKEKYSISNGLRDDGILVLNGDTKPLCDLAKNTDTFRILFFGTSSDGLSARLISAEQRENVLQCSIELGHETLSVNLQAFGVHTARNATAAALAAKSLFPFLTGGEIAKGLESFQAPAMRLNLKVMRNGKQILDDAYNANPISMNAFVEVARDFQTQGKRVGFIVGDMLELGAQSKEYHAELGQKLKTLHPQFVAAVGEFSQLVCDQAKAPKTNVFPAKTPEEAAGWALSQEFDIVCVKGSRGIALDRAIKKLLEA